VQKVTYKYKSIATSLSPAKFDLMPVIPITVSFKKEKMNVEALIDSGAVRCFCPIEIGRNLGIPLDQCPRGKLFGLGGDIETRIHKIQIAIEYGKYKFPADVDFGEFRFHGFSFILGQQDFFKNVNVNFERRKKRVVLYIPE
jgi:hypothetical protein